MCKKKKISFILAAVVFVIAALLFATPLLLLHQMMDRHISYNTLISGEDYGIEAKEHFATTEDGLNIALYEVKAENPKAVIITLSGIEKPSGTAFMGHAAMFREHSYSTVMVEMRAHGRSEGDQICLGYKETLDVGAALSYIKQQEEYKGLPVIIMGLSMGGGTAINAMAEYPELSALISLSAFSSCEETFAEILQQSMPEFLALAIKPFLYSATFLRYGKAVSLKPVKSITALNGRPALLMHTTEDSNVSYSNFLRLQEAAPSSAQFISYEGDEHFITAEFLHPENDVYYSNALLCFIESVL